MKLGLKEKLKRERTSRGEGAKARDIRKMWMWPGKEGGAVPGERREANSGTRFALDSEGRRRSQTFPESGGKNIKGGGRHTRLIEKEAGSGTRFSNSR